MNPVKVGIVGCGAISPAYFTGSRIYDQLKIVACADLDVSRARARAEEFGVPRAMSVEDLLADDEVELVINLTVPQAHAPVSLAALRAGKHVYLEKPLALDLQSAQAVIGLAGEKNLRIGCAPDTFLGGGIQTARHAVDLGTIGQPVAATAFCCGHGHEGWHPSPQFYYQRGGGPMFDMGPYYLTALINLIGPCANVSGSTRISFPTRTITSQPLAGTVIPVETPTHLAGTLEFAGGAIVTMIMSFDIWGHQLPCIEIHGTDGSLVVPDPNRFDGDVQLMRASTRTWERIPHTHRTDIGRGTGVADMAAAIRSGRPHRASGETAMHVVEIMAAFERSSTERKHIAIKSRVDRPAALLPDLPLGHLD